MARVETTVAVQDTVCCEQKGVNVDRYLSAFRGSFSGAIPSMLKRVLLFSESIITPGTGD